MKGITTAARFDVAVRACHGSQGTRARAGAHFGDRAATRRRCLVALATNEPVAERPGDSLPRRGGHGPAPRLPGLADEIIAAIAARVPDYARPMEGPFGQGVRSGSRRRFDRSSNLVEDPARPRAGARSTSSLGRGEMRAGPQPRRAAGAYRLGARVAWRRLSRPAAGGLEPGPSTSWPRHLRLHRRALGRLGRGLRREQAAPRGELPARRRRPRRAAAGRAGGRAAVRPAADRRQAAPAARSGAFLGARGRQSPDGWRQPGRRGAGGPRRPSRRRSPTCCARPAPRRGARAQLETALGRRPRRARTGAVHWRDAPVRHWPARRGVRAAAAAGARPLA